MTTTTASFPMVSVKSTLNTRGNRPLHSQSLKLPDLVVKSAPAGVKRKPRTNVYKYKLLPGNNVRVVLAALRKRPWWHPTTAASQDSEDSPDLPTFLWEMYRNPKRYTGKYENVILNHIQNNNCLVSKKGLYFCLKAHCESTGLDILKIIPRTFYLSNDDLSSPEMKCFLDYNTSMKGKATAVTKPVSASTTTKKKSSPLSYAEVAASPSKARPPVGVVAASTVDGGEVVPLQLEAEIEGEGEGESPSDEGSVGAADRPPAAEESPTVSVVLPSRSASGGSSRGGGGGEGGEGVIWIMKPASKTNRGFGIKVVRGVQEVMELVSGATAVSDDEGDDEEGGGCGGGGGGGRGGGGAGGCNRPPAHSSKMTADEKKSDSVRLAALGRDARKKAAREGWIVQEYLTRPLLVSGRKFDIRCFVVITCIPPRGIRGYFFKEAYVRTSCKKYSLDTLSDRETHLTNDAVQKYSKAYGKFESGNKLSMSEWQATIDRDYPTAPANVVEGLIMPEIKRLTGLSIAAAAGSGIGTSDINKSFELLGYDYMVDEDFNPKLIEINSNPCLEFACPLLTDLISSLIENVVRLGLDTMCPPPPAGHRTKACEAAVAAIEGQESKFELLYH